MLHADLCSLFYGGVTVLTGPVVGKVTETSAIVLLEVEFEAPVSCVATDALTGKRVEMLCFMKSKQPHAFRLDGLEPARHYDARARAEFVARRTWLLRRSSRGTACHERSSRSSRPQVRFDGIEHPELRRGSFTTCALLSSELDALERDPNLAKAMDARESKLGPPARADAGGSLACPYQRKFKLLAVSRDAPFPDFEECPLAPPVEARSAASVVFFPRGVETRPSEAPRGAAPRRGSKPAPDGGAATRPLTAAPRRPGRATTTCPRGGRSGRRTSKPRRATARGCRISAARA